MNKEEFLRQLEQLLGSISPEERADAMAYYRSYFEDAGIENEASILKELESPQKVAQSILKDAGVEDDGQVKDAGKGARADDNRTGSSDNYRYGSANDNYRYGSTNNGYGSTNNGYGSTNGSYGSANSGYGTAGGSYGSANSGYGTAGSGYGTSNQAGGYGYGGETLAEQNKRKNKDAAVVIGIIAVVLLSPLWGSLLVALFSVIVGVFAALFGVALAVVIVMGVMLFVGILMIVIGFASIGSGSLAAGICVIGIGFVSLGIGILAVIATVWVCGVFVPWACKGIAGACKNMWNKRKGKKLL